MGIALPSFGRLPAGLRTRRTLTEIERCFAQARLTAMASGNKVKIGIDFEAGRFTATLGKKENDYVAILQRHQHPEWAEMEEEPTIKRSAFFEPIGYQLRKGVKIAPPEEDTDLYSAEEQNERYSYEFYSDGEAFGPILDLEIGTKKYLLAVDNLTGKPLITPQED